MDKLTDERVHAEEPPAADPWTELAAYLEGNGYGSSARLAAACGRHQSAITRVVKHGERPSPAVAIVIERETGIPMQRWWEAEPPRKAA